MEHSPLDHGAGRLRQPPLLQGVEHFGLHRKAILLGPALPLERRQEFIHRSERLLRSGRLRQALLNCSGDFVRFHATSRQPKLKRNTWLIACGKKSSSAMRLDAPHDVVQQSSGDGSAAAGIGRLRGCRKDDLWRIAAAQFGGKPLQRLICGLKLWSAGETLVLRILSNGAVSLQRRVEGLRSRTPRWIKYFGW